MADTAVLLHAVDRLISEDYQQTLTAEFIVKNANDVFDALGAANIPKEGDPYNNIYSGDGLQFELRDLFVTRREVAPYDANLLDGNYRVTVTWGTGTTTTFRNDVQQVEWRIGSIRQTIEVDISGNKIGVPTYWKDDAGNPAGVPKEDERGGLLQDPLSEHSAEVSIPTMDAYIQMPRHVPINIPAFLALTGKTNNREITIGGMAIPKAYAIYLGVQATPIANPVGSSTHTMIHHIRVGGTQIPRGLSVFNQNGSAATFANERLAPIKFGLVPRYRTGIINFDGTGNRESIHSLLAINLHYNGNFSVLGIT